MGAGATVRLVALAGALILTSCGSSSAPRTPTTGPPAAPTEANNPSYGGLGGTVAAFNAQNPHRAGVVAPGVANYTVDATSAAGRVTAYHVEINAPPPFGDRQRIGLLAGTNLPSDAVEIYLRGNTCIVWRSRSLMTLVGRQYAVGTTVTATKTARMSAERSARCP